MFMLIKCKFSSCQIKCQNTRLPKTLSRGLLHSAHIPTIETMIPFSILKIIRLVSLNPMFVNVNKPHDRKEKIINQSNHSISVLKIPMPGSP